MLGITMNNDWIEWKYFDNDLTWSLFNNLNTLLSRLDLFSLFRGVLFGQKNPTTKQFLFLEFRKCIFKVQN